MDLTVQGHKVFASTGGRSFIPQAGEVVVFLHGSGQSHLGFQRQSRFFAYRGFQVLAPDFPAHGLSAGEPLSSIKAQADWLAEFLTEAGVERAHIVGHSQGGLVALEFGRCYGSRTQSLTFLATALAIPVNRALLDLASEDEAAAIAAMMDWGHGNKGHRHAHPTPGVSHLRYGSRLMNANRQGVLHTDLTACADYQDGPEAANTIASPALCVLAGQDRMTPIAQGRLLAQSLPNATAIEVPQSGHMIISEYPGEVNRALRTFLSGAMARPALATAR